MRKLHRVVISAVVAAGLVAGCGGDDSDDGVDVSAVEAQVQEEISGPPIESNVTSVSCPDDMQAGTDTICTVTVGQEEQRWTVELTADGQVDYVQQEGNIE